MEFGYATYPEDTKKHEETAKYVKELEQFDPALHLGDEEEFNEIGSQVPEGFKYNISETEVMDRDYKPMEKAAPLTVADSLKFSN